MASLIIRTKPYGQTKAVNSCPFFSRGRCLADGCIHWQPYGTIGGVNHATGQDASCDLEMEAA